jgi:hypothetical protein
MARNTVSIKFLADVDGMKRGIDQVNGQLGVLSKGMKAFGVATAAYFAAGPIVDFAKEAITAASDLSEALNKNSVVFDDAAKRIEVFSKSAADNLGLSQTAALNAASTFGTIGKAAGLVGNDLAGFSTSFSTLAADLASFSNTSVEDAVTAIGAAFRGEQEPIRKYGVLIDDAALKQEALALGIYSGKGALDAQSKILATQSLLWKQTTDAQGDFARTQDGLANATRILSAQFDNLKASIGTAFLRGFGATSDATNDLSDAMDNLEPLLEAVSQTFGELVGDLVKVAGAAGRAVGPFADLVNSITGTEEGFGNLVSLLSGPVYTAFRGAGRAADFLNEQMDAAGIGAGGLSKDAQVLADRWNGVANAAARAAVAQAAAARAGQVARANNAATDRYTALAVEQYGKSVSFTGGTLTDYFNALNKVNTATSGVGSSTGSAAAEVEKFKVKWADLAKTVNESADGLTVKMSGITTIFGEKQNALLEAATGKFKDAIATQSSIIKSGYEAIASYAASVVSRVTGSVNIADFIITDAEGKNPIFDAVAYQAALTSREDMVTALAPIATKIPEAWSQAILGLPTDKANALISWLTNNPDTVPQLITDLNALATTTETLLAEPMALAFATVGGKSAVALIEEAKKQIEKDSDAFQRFVRKQLKARVTVEVEYVAVNSPQSATGGSAGRSTVAALQDYERLNGTAWRVA